ncbi:serine/threonine protein kinase [Pseudoclavibacter sp. RFBJ3]|uniref:serine/threonine-protein kinase n=1 Tax=unclassified Pseudoclavibacter TaxID=2615177 RepID=UPI000CE9356F|nr:MULTISPECIES: serine/threonine-protein kinase [unclassified Pseudoclavibacter]PPF80989.1 serine/threonine protein kinase [Pseudoclavibacter sp. RFBJ5]PPF94497.1 serine/threonine protein kinase [Pseudoclavibacter sp. RFBJ3]PPF99605.1 serine/threonine protein kinase [Pseudoclavibacter sp. RFBH5]PPG25799.1 serine/threonine protein kinase [Pseudoclavibacter sp. RFBI4]
MAGQRRSPAEPPEIPGYLYRKHLGSGGFSDVFLYEQQFPRRLVAVKVLLGGDDLGETSRQAFIGEANLMAQMSSHPYIVTIFQADVAGDGRPYFVMEYASGLSLSDRYKREQIPVEEALRTGVRISSAVATAHTVGILHRDVKPANILTNDFGWPALTDFGISSAVDDELAEADDLVEAPPTGGGGLSVPWSPPEMFEDEPKPDVRSEVFSLGATVYSLVAGHTPFERPGERNTTLDLISRIERGAISPILRGDVPRSLVSVLHKAMARNPAHRYQSAVEFAYALQRVELELNYAPTAIDVPNMTISATAATGGGDADATSLRPVSLINAQVHEGARASKAELTSARAVVRVAAQQSRGGFAARYETASGPRTGRRPRGTEHTGGAPSDDSGPTTARPITTPARAAAVAAAPARTFGEASGSTIDAPASRADELARERAANAAASSRKLSRNGLVGVIAGGLVLAIGIVAAISWMLAPADEEIGRATTTPVSIQSGGFPPVLVAPVAVRSPDGSVTFSWSNPDPQPGDVYYWRLGEGGKEGATTSETSVVIPNVQDGAVTCIEVEIRRGGKVSSEPLEVCYPQ